MKGYIVYYLHYEDKEFKVPAWNKRPDFVKCVGADSPDKAQNWVSSQFKTPIKHMGLASCRLEDCEILLEN